MSAAGDIAGLFPALPGLPGHSPGQCAPLSLAYVGDTVYDLYVRTLLLHQSDATVRALHARAAGLVCAKAQAEAFRRIEPLFTEEEADMARRGRNAHMGTVPKHASIADYRAATAFETLLGWLWLRGEDERIRTLMAEALGPYFAPEETE